VKSWVTRTPDGQPDIQGTWTNFSITPFERPESLGNKAFLTEEEVAKEEKERAAHKDVDRPPRSGDVGTYNAVFNETGIKALKTRQTSLVVDPPNGRVPLTPAATAARDHNLERVGESYIYMSPWDRCITRGMPAGMFPAAYNNAYQIIQTPGQVVIISEMIHEVRVIPIDGSPHLPADVHLWDGDSRGHWDGNTLVVDTTNFNNKGWIGTSAATGRIKGVPQTEKMHVVEHFTRTDVDTLNYDAAIEDPAMYTRPWRVEYPLARDNAYRMYEYACHEGNYAMEDMLGGGNTPDRQAVSPPTR
jgi:hypothetical protein